MERKILVAVDGSIACSNAIRYFGQLFSDLEEIQVHLISVVPAGPVPIGLDWVNEQDRLSSLSPEVRTAMRSAKNNLKKAAHQLHRLGITPQQVSVGVQLTQKGVAADVIHEARQGYYDALLIGRRGLSKIEELFLGSLSSAVAEKCYDLPLWIVDGKVETRKFLLPVDRSFNSLRAADHLGFILKDNPYAEISLMHLSALLGGDTDPDVTALYQAWGKEWCEENLERDDSIYHAPEQILLERGIEPERICRIWEGRCISPHKSIIKRSVDDNGTIVIGRRAKSEKKGFLKGVSDNIMEMASQVAIWVV